MHEVVNLVLAKGNKGVSTITACRRVAELVMAEVRLAQQGVAALENTYSVNDCFVHTGSSFAVELKGNRLSHGNLL